MGAWSKLWALLFQRKKLKLTKEFWPPYEAMITRLRVGDPLDPSPRVFRQWYEEHKRTGVSAEKFLEWFRLHRPPLPWSTLTVRALGLLPGEYGSRPVQIMPVVIPPELIREDTRLEWGTHPDQLLAADLFVSAGGLIFVVDVVGATIHIKWNEVRSLKLEHNSSALEYGGEFIRVELQDDQRPWFATGMEHSVFLFEVYDALPPEAFEKN